jgi:hypothetical protein
MNPSIPCDDDSIDDDGGYVASRADGLGGLVSNARRLRLRMPVG